MFFLALIGGGFFLVFSSSIVCAVLGSKAASTAPSASAAPTPLAQLPTAPTTVLKPSKIHAGTDKKDQVYEYGALTGLPGHGLELTVHKTNAAAWRIGFWEQKGGGHVEDFAPSGGVKEVQQDEDFRNVVGNFYEISSGSLKGAVVWRSPAISDWPADAGGNGRTISIMSIAFAIDGGVGSRMLDWLCDGKHAGADTMDRSTFENQCEGMVKEKLISPTSADFPDGFLHSVPVLSTNRCGLSWDAWVDSKNAFGVDIRHTFVCKYDPTANLVSLTFN